MSDVDRSWVDRHLAVLVVPLARHLQGKPTFFAPSQAFYSLLADGDADGLQQGADLLAAHLGLSVAPLVIYELGLRMPMEVAGQISTHGHRRSRIEIPLYYVGKPLPLGAILAHELTHAVLHQCGIAGQDVTETERLTDLASIAMGLGALVLNGMVVGEAAGAAETQVLGYLGPEAKAYALYRMAHAHNVAKDAILACLTPEAAAVVASLGATPDWP